MIAAVSSSAPVTERQMQILEHSLGNPTHYRNYFCTSDTGDGGKDYKIIYELVALGLMVRGRTAAAEMGGYTYFHVTDAGKAVAFAAAEVDMSAGSGTIVLEPDSGDHAPPPPTNHLPRADIPRGRARD